MFNSTRIIFRIIIAVSLFAPVSVGAVVAQYTGARLQNPVSRIMQPQNLIDLLVTIFQFLGGPIVVIGLIYAGFKLVTAQGDEKTLTEGKRALVWVIVGAAIILGASVLQGVVQGTITGLQ